ncbi:MAG: hypothetical protein R6U08_03540 [Bacillota bacterium]
MFERTKILAAVLVLAVLISTLGGTVSAEEEFSLTYRIKIRPDEGGRVEVALDGLNSSSVNFMMGTVDRTDLKDNISNFRAVDPAGEELSVTRGGRGWRINTGSNPSITVSYDFGLRFIQESGRDWHFVDIDPVFGYFYNEAVFAFPDAEPDEVIVEYDLPNDWDVATHFTPLGGNRFRVEGVPNYRQDLLLNTTRVGFLEYQVDKDYEDLSMSFYSFKPSPYALQYGLGEFWRPHYGTTPEEEMEIYLDLTYDAIQEMIGIFGYWPAGRRYIVTSRASDDELNSITGYKNWVPAWTRERRTDMHHHVVHAWMWPGAIVLDEGRDDWMAEGIPMYYQTELPARMENDDMWLGLHYMEYLILKRADQFGLRDKETVYVYPQNHMRVLALDRAIREASDGQKNIDDLMAYIGREYGENSKAMRHQDMIKAINEITESDLSKFYNRYMIGEIASEIPPVENFIDQYQEPFLEWMDTYVETPGYVVGNRTMLLIGLEIGLHNETRYENEHAVASRVNLYFLRNFRSALAQKSGAITENTVIETLSEITGADQSDFFDFYTIGDFTPSVDEVASWYRNPPQEEDIKEIREGIPHSSVKGTYDSSDEQNEAYLEPSTLLTGVSQEVTLVILDDKLVSREGKYVRITVDLSGEENLGECLSSLDAHLIKSNIDSEDRLGNYEVGFLPLEKTERGWEGTFNLMLPQNFENMRVQAKRTSRDYCDLSIQMTDELDDKAAEREEQGEVEDKTILSEIMKVLFDQSGLIYSGIVIFVLVGFWIYLASVKNK